MIAKPLSMALKSKQKFKKKQNEKLAKGKPQRPTKSTIKFAQNKDNSDNIAILMNLAYTETKESIAEAVMKYGKIQSIQMYNTNNVFTGKAKVTFVKLNKSIYNDEIIMSNKIVKVLREKKKVDTVTSCNRVILKNIIKTHKIVDVRKIIKEAGYKVANVKVKNTGDFLRNNGYCFVEFKGEEDTKKFVEEYENVKEKFGKESTVEYTNEKITKINR